MEISGLGIQFPNFQKYVLILINHLSNKLLNDMVTLEARNLRVYLNSPIRKSTQKIHLPGWKSTCQDYFSHFYLLILIWNINSF